MATALSHFHPAVAQWFNGHFAAPTPPQEAAWQAVSRGDHVLVAAPTGSGKTLAAFLGAINGLATDYSKGLLTESVSVIYVSPLKALSHDIQRNLQAPLQAIGEQLVQANQCINDVAELPLRAAVRTGDTSRWERTQMIKRPPNILVTTPESLYILLTSDSGRQLLSTARTLIVDEVHAMIGNKRGAHLALSIERLRDLCGRELNRIGLSATQEPIAVVRQFLLGESPNKPCAVIDSGHQRERDLSICLPPSPLAAVMSGEVWGEVYRDLEALIADHHTTLIFVNTRRLAERLAKALGERLGEEAVTSHHGSLAKEHRFDAEQRLKSGTLKALVATSSLELGIDIGDIDLVCQIGSPRAVSLFLQRVGRSGHSIGKTPKGRLFPLSRGELVECVALLDAVRQGALDQLAIYPAPLDVLAQQIVAEVSAGERRIETLFNLFTNAHPYCELRREKFDAVVQMLAEGFTTRYGRRSAHIHLDAVNGIIKPRKGTRLTALANGGVIPDRFDYDVILQPENFKVGTLNEDFSFESLPGDVFQLGNTSYQIIRIELGKVFVRDAKGMPPSIPFWFGEAPGRSDVMSGAVSRLMQFAEHALTAGAEQACEILAKRYFLDRSVASQLAQYLGASFTYLGALPNQNRVIFERFFDDAADQHLVIHSGFGSRINRAWGLALRKRFCRKFNFELQAAALEDTIVLSLGSTHSFPLDEPARYLKPDSVRDVLTQALLDAPMFPSHWRWNATIALAIRRFSNGAKTPPQLQRTNAEDLMAVIFPDQIACAENISGLREIPDHPLVEQTLYDCLHDLMDVSGLENILERMQSGQLELVCRELAAPSPLSEEVLTAKPYAFLDDVPAEERRTALVRTRNHLQPEDISAMGELDAQVIQEVREEVWPTVRDTDECHDALMILGGASDIEATEHGWHPWLHTLAAHHRATRIFFGEGRCEQRWTAAERLAYWQCVHPDLALEPAIAAPGIPAETANGAIRELLRMRLQGVGPVSAHALAKYLGITTASAEQELMALEREGYAMQSVFRTDDAEAGETRWCERGTLARIHRRTLKTLRKRVQPVSISGYMRFLFQWQGLDPESLAIEASPQQLAAVLNQLEGFAAPAGAWEERILPDRLSGYRPCWLDTLSASGQISWVRPSAGNGQKPKMIGKQSAVALVRRVSLSHWLRYGHRAELPPELSAQARRVYQCLQDHGAQFFDDLLAQGGWVAAEIEHGLSELAGYGIVSSDNFAGLRGLIQSSAREPGYRSRRARNPGTATPSSGNAGRWSITGKSLSFGEDDWPSVEYIVSRLLNRYGILLRSALGNERHLPGWREMLYVLRRMEARGEIRGGRFVSGVAEEQFALPEAVAMVRRAEREARQGLVMIGAADPLNMTGILLPAARVAAVRGNRLLFRDGHLVAAKIAADIRWFAETPDAQRWQLQQTLIRR